MRGPWGAPGEVCAGREAESQQPGRAFKTSGLEELAEVGKDGAPQRLPGGGAAAQARETGTGEPGRREEWQASQKLGGDRVFRTREQETGSELLRISRETRRGN